MKAMYNLASVICIACILNKAVGSDHVSLHLQALGCKLDCRDKPLCEASINIDGVELADGLKGVHVAVIKSRTGAFVKTGRFSSLKTHSKRMTIKTFFENITNGDIILMATQRSCSRRNWHEYFHGKKEKWNIDVPPLDGSWTRGSSLVMAICKGPCSQSTVGGELPWVKIIEDGAGPQKHLITLIKENPKSTPLPTLFDDLLPTLQLQKPEEKHKMPLVVGVSTALAAFALVVILVLTIRKLRKSDDTDRDRTGSAKISDIVSRQTSSSSYGGNDAAGSRYAKAASDSNKGGFNSAHSSRQSSPLLAGRKLKPALSVSNEALQNLKIELISSVENLKRTPPSKSSEFAVTINPKPDIIGERDRTKYVNVKEVDSKVDCKSTYPDNLKNESLNRYQNPKSIQNYEPESLTQNHVHSSENREYDTPNGSPSGSHHSSAGNLTLNPIALGTSCLLFKQSSGDDPTITENSYAKPAQNGEFSQYVTLDDGKSVYKTPSNVAKHDPPKMRPPMRQDTYVSMTPNVYEPIEGVYEPLTELDLTPEDREYAPLR